MENKPKNLNSIVVGKYYNLGKVSPMGSLEVRKQASGSVMFYWRYYAHGKNGRVAIGLYDSSSPPRSIEPNTKGFYSINAAQRKAESLAVEHQNNLLAGGSGYVEVKEAQTEALQKKQTDAIEQCELTLEQLFMLYCDLLESQGKQSHRDARGVFRNHVLATHAKLANTAARDITIDDIADVLRFVNEKGIGRTANVLRSYLHAAFRTSIRARTSMTIPVSFKKFNVTVNPVTDIEPNRRANRSDKNPLSIEEMRIYWNLIENLNTKHGAVLRLHLLSGAPRPAQLVRLMPRHACKDSYSLFDIKGQRHEAREYKTPLTKLSKSALDVFHESYKAGLYLLSSDGGKTHISPETVNDWAQDIVGDKIEKFTIKRARSGVETLLASKGIPPHIRAQLQSHGITGVQSEHYDGYDYLKEKAHALAILESTLTQADGDNLIRLRA